MGGTAKVLSMGLAARAQAQWKRRKVEMKFTVTHVSAPFLNNLLRNVQGLGTFFLGVQAFPHYKVPDKDKAGARQLLSLQRWIDKELKMWEGKDIPVGWTKELTLQRTYADRLIAMLEHYEVLGQQAMTVDPYWQLRDALEGRDFNASLDDPSDCSEEDIGDLVEDDEPVEEEKKVAEA
jgi:hypothetical protein